DFHSGGDEFGGLGEQAIVGVIFITRFSENGTENDGDIFCAQKIFDFIAFGAAGEDHAQFLFFAILDGVTNVASTIGKDENGKLAANDGHERFKLHVAFEVGRTAVSHGLGIVAGAVEQIGELRDLLFVF